MVAIMGTSTCHVMSADVLREVPGMCGVVDGGIIAGRWGYEAGQSGVGDIFGWFVDNAVPASYTEAAAAAGESVHEHLTDLAAQQAIGEHGLVALDWHSGNRSVLVDHELSGLVVGPTLATRPEDVYRALLEATAFGTRVIVETFRDSGVPGRGVRRRRRPPEERAADADLLRRHAAPPLGDRLRPGSRSRLGDSRRRRGRRLPRRPPPPPRRWARSGKAVYVPDEVRAQAYDRLFAEYRELHDHFGRGVTAMRRLKAIRREAVAGKEHS